MGRFDAMESTLLMTTSVTTISPTRPRIRAGTTADGRPASNLSISGLGRGTVGEAVAMKRTAIQSSSRGGVAAAGAAGMPLSMQPASLLGASFGSGAGMPRRAL